MSIQLLCLLLLLFLSSSFPELIHSQCNPSEISALLQFKNNFEIDCTSSSDPFAYPKTSSWRRNMTKPKWDGVVCDQLNGHVIGLDLSSSCLYGPINSSSTLFGLVHLEHLNLAFNNFNLSNIPSELGGLSRLSYLNLSTSYLVGRVPLEISKLTKLASLDLSYTTYMEKGLELNLKSLIQSLTALEELDLRYANINSEIPSSLMNNMSSLRSLKLDTCGLHGEFPSDILLHLPELQYISISGNEKLRGSLPDFKRSSRLESIKVGYTAFTGKIPNSVGNLAYLIDLDLGNCNFSGSLPASLGNLSQLVYLDLSENNFMAFNPQSLSWVGMLSKLTTLSLSSINLKHEGEIPSSLANLTKLSYLSLAQIQFTGQIPYWLTNFTQLSFLSFSKNQLKGQIPPQFMNLTKLAYLNLAYNNLQGSISPLLNLRNLASLYLNGNNFSGVLELGMFLELKKLYVLQISSNNLTLLQSRNISTVPPNFLVLGLSSCRLSKFPEFLKNQNELIFLDLADNEIEGQLPKWMENMSVDSLQFLNISHNQITGKLPLPWTYFYGLDISFNKLRGSLPIPSPPTVLYFARNNGFSGEVSSSICDLTYLRVLDLSSLHLSGELPHCFSQSSKELRILNLRNNSFRGSIPEFCKKETNNNLRMIDLNSNQFQGKLPRSLVNCDSLDFLNVGDNLINDTFPSWLGFLPRLSVMILRANKLHGPIRMIPQKSKNNQFPLMRIVDLSHNNLSGKLPSRYFEQWIAMKNTNLSNPEYIGQSMTDYLFIGFYDYSLTMYTKGMELEYLKILDALIAIDLSSNKFEGVIPNTLGDLSGLRFLKLSNNHLSGSIPWSIGKLSQLESLDLSSNRLSAEIPQQLTQLTALSFFDVSDNNLAGKIPRGRQFDTFQNNSYLGNLGLCGQPLSRQCEDDTEQEGTPPPPEMVVEKDDDKFDLNWVTALFGFGGGLVVGVAVESMVDLRRPILSFWMRWRRASSRRGRQRPLTRRNR